MRSEEKQEIFCIINNIKELQHLVNAEWEDHFQYDHINYKRKYISNVWFKDSGYDSPFFVMILNYLRLLQTFMPLAEKYAPQEYVRKRIKQHFSVMEKLQKYIDAKEKGDVAIAKCLNDLLGFRKIVSSSNDYDKIYNELSAELSNDKNLRVIKSFHGDYRAVHIYIQEHNYTFPWELQIWRYCDEENNEDSHRLYKQEYVTNSSSYERKEN